MKLQQTTRAVVVGWLMAMAPLGGCTRATEGYCADDAQCQDPSWEHHDPALPV